MRYLLNKLIMLSLLFTLPAISHSITNEEAVQLIEDHVKCIEAIAVLFTIRTPRHTKADGRIQPESKKIALAARGPLQYDFENLLQVSDYTHYIYEDFDWLGSGHYAETQPYHHVAFYDGKQTYTWMTVLNQKQTIPGEPTYPNPSLMNIFKPFHYFSWLEHVLLSPIHLFINQDMHAKAAEYNPQNYKNEITITDEDRLLIIDAEIGPNGFMNYLIDFHKENGIKRVESRGTMPSELIVDQYKEVNGVKIPSRGRVIYEDHTVRMNMIDAKVNDQVPMEVFKKFEVAEDEAGTDVNFKLNQQPSYFEKFFDTNITEVYQKYMEL